MLAISKVTIADPDTAVEKGDVWTAGPHTLACFDVIREWASWIALLEGDMILCPYPGPYILLADGPPMLCVQPDTYLAGHALDRWNEQHPAAVAKKKR